jgi:hypothetical protein
MSTQDGMSRQEEIEVPELALNKESLSDLDVDGSQVKGGAGIIAVAPQLAPVYLDPGAIRAHGTSVI